MDRATKVLLRRARHSLRLLEGKRDEAIRMMSPADMNLWDVLREYHIRIVQLDDEIARLEGK